MELVTANDMSRFFTLDLIIASIAFLIFVLIEGKRSQMKYLWVYFLFTLGIGLSFAFPLFLYMREVRIDPVKSV
jgi:hypothetical protein